MGGVWVGGGACRLRWNEYIFVFILSTVARERCLADSGGGGGGGIYMVVIIIIVVVMVMKITSDRILVLHKMV